MQKTNMSKSTPRYSQRLFLDQKCANCLLLTYVKRSLSLNEGWRKHQPKQLKRMKGGSKAKQASSDPSTLSSDLSAERLLKINKCPECTASASDLLCERGLSKTKRRSLFGGFRSLFSKKKHDLKVNGVGGFERHCGKSKTQQWEFTCSVSSHNLSEEESESSQTDSTPVPGSAGGLSDVSVDSSTYFEKVSEELEGIVKEIQFSPEEDSSPLPSAACLGDCSSAGDDTTKRIISLLKQHGDVIDQKISRNKSVQNFLQKLTYSSFQQLADRYIAQIPNPLPQTTDASPELVRLAFTMDFTAKVAGLCSHTVGRIMGFGYQYLQDSFSQMCAAQTQVPEDLEGQNTCDPD
ncbi:apoptosis facilitator Bcl-2-like protein 14 [Pseudorasbora parva]|uniref:apoptosis facilitator Bcl-2-like protein 14 n=1 Tax=Pseudorasbora parva TaxID=51549 RepID=UPI00351E7E21